MFIMLLRTTNHSLLQCHVNARVEPNLRDGPKEAIASGDGLASPRSEEEEEKKKKKKRVAIRDNDCLRLGCRGQGEDFHVVAPNPSALPADDQFESAANRVPLVESPDLVAMLQNVAVARP